MKKLALLLSLLALGALGLVACGGGDNDEATAASAAEAARDRTSCGRVRVNGPYPPMMIAVAEGNVSCRVSRGVMEDLYRGRGRLADAEHSPAPFYLVRGSWRCGGTDGAQECKKAQRTPSAKTIRTHPAVEADPGPNPRLSDEEIIAKRGNEWAPLFAEGGYAPSPCRYMGQPACERMGCERVGNWPIKNCTPVSADFRESFADATVERVVFEGRHATAEFSNGESVEFEGKTGEQWFITERWIKKIARRNFEP